MQWVFLSPHLDDAALSCGGWIYQKIQAGAKIEICTICAGDPPPDSLSPLAEELHARWGSGASANQLRQAEDLRASRRLGASARHLAIPDCIYRRDPLSGHPLIERNEDLFQSLPDSQIPLAETVAGELARLFPPGVQLACPIALGDHIDHHLTRKAAEMLKRPLWYYADYPYLLQSGNPSLAERQPGWSAHHLTLSLSALAAWQDAVSCYRSQISTFWKDEQQMRAAIEQFWRQDGGSTLWAGGQP
ncbi:MAG: PIG-L family deacetylase [Chloroflexota bacterium]|jgi:LmbE family N-acetylglucosaminyl deacetylase